MIVISSIVSPLSSYRYKIIKELICNILAVYGFNSANSDFNLVKSFLLPILVNERDIELTVITKTDQFILFKFGDIQLLDVMKIRGGATNLNPFSKANKTSDKKGFFSYEWFDCPGKNQSTELPSHDAFYSKLRSSNPLEAEQT